MWLKEPKEKTDNKASKVFARPLSISHFITDVLFLCFVLYFMHLPSTQKFFTSFICRLIEKIPTVMLILLGSQWIECSVIIPPMQMPQTD